jgi:putative sigma-54 modulation protein
MSVTVSGRGESITAAMKEYAESKVQEIIEGKNKISSAEVILATEKNRQKVEILVHGKHLIVEADFESYDMFESIDKAIAKADRQLEKFFDKKQDHHKHSQHLHVPTLEEEDVNENFEED